MLKYLSIIAVSMLCFLTQAQNIKYNLKMPKPQNHYFNVEMELDGFKEKELNVKMPIWAPGSYLAREFAKHVNLVKAFDGNGNAIEVVKTNKNTWCIKKGKAKKVIVKYEVYSFELTVRTSFLDLTHGFVSGSGVFMYVNDYKADKGQVEVFPHESFSIITTALKQSQGASAGSESTLFDFENYDQLVDCPMEIGNQETFSFMAAGIKHNVAIYARGNHDIELLKVDMARVVETATAIFGQNPNEEYTFIIHNVVDGQGGLEHVNSTVLSTNRWRYQNDYKGFLKLVSHEYFHLWNVKRIRPVELGPFNYDAENYTSLLWVMEGFTSYYEKMILLRSGIWSEKEFLNGMFGSLNYVEGSVGTRVQPVAHASFDAWIKAYRPNENSRNTTMSYYSRGSVVAMFLDAKIIKKYDGKKCLDHFMQQVYKEYYEKKGRGFSESEFKKELEDFLGENMDQFYADYINGTKVPNYDEVFSSIGLKVNYAGVSKVDAGVSLSESGGKVEIRSIRSNSPIEEAGLSVNDEIIGANGIRVNKSTLESFFAGMSAGDVMEILFARGDELFSTDLKMTEYEKPRYEYSKIEGNDVLERLFNYWLRTE
ncbi:MAG: PDZ domain-containing protein [Crocinitomicaceae bacterium]|nr:PDZ domain-containing protein [Crocinitomicaceae bacterium]